MTAEQILAAARACIGTPFRHQGRQPGVGLDCAGLAVVVADAIGCPVIDHAGYGELPAGGRLEALLDAQPGLQRIDVTAPQAGDLLLLRLGGDPQHLAIHAGETMIHAWAGPGRCCEHRLSPAWRSRIVRAYRFVEVAA